MDDLDRLPQMDREWRAWRLLCEFLFNVLDIDIDHNDTLHTAITAWGEELAALRRAQGETIVERVLEEHRAKVRASTYLQKVYAEKVNV